MNIFLLKVKERYNIFYDNEKNRVEIYSEDSRIFLLKSEIYIDRMLEDTYVLDRYMTGLKKEKDRDIGKNYYYYNHKLLKGIRKPTSEKDVEVRLVLHYRIGDREMTSSDGYRYSRNPSFSCGTYVSY